MYDMNFSELDVKLLNKLGFTGGCLVMPFKTFSEYENQKKKIKNKNILLGVSIKTDKIKELQSFSLKFKKADVLFAEHCPDEVNRIAFEESLVDVVNPSLSGRLDFMKNLNSGFDHIMAQLGATNHVALEFNFRDFALDNTILPRMRQNSRLCRKYKTPFFVTSGAENKFEYISNGILMSFGELIEFERNELKLSFSELPLNFWRRKNQVLPGIRIID